MPGQGLVSSDPLGCCEGRFETFCARSPADKPETKSGGNAAERFADLRRHGCSHGRVRCLARATARMRNSSAFGSRPRISRLNRAAARRSGLGCNAQSCVFRRRAQRSSGLQACARKGGSARRSRAWRRRPLDRPRRGRPSMGFTLAGAQAASHPWLTFAAAGYRLRV